jgi:hypothetical protein
VEFHSLPGGLVLARVFVCCDNLRAAKHRTAVRRISGVRWRALWKGPRRKMRRRGYRSDELNFPRREDWLAEIFVAEVGDGLLVQVGVVGVEGVAEGGVHGGGCGDSIEEAADVADAA